MCAWWVFLLNCIPWICFFLLETESDATFFFVNAQDHHFKCVTKLHHLGWMLDALPCHVGDVEQSIDAVKIQEDAEVCDVLYNACTNFVNLDVLEQFRFLR